MSTADSDNDGKPDDVIQYYQDWWDSRMKYPSYINPSENTAILFDSVYDMEEYEQIKYEKQRRYGENSFETDSDVPIYGVSPHTWNENWVYESENEDTFLGFDAGDDFDGNNINFFPSGFTCLTDIVPAHPENSNDPWFQKPPSIIEIRVYLFDRKKDNTPKHVLTEVSGQILKLNDWKNPDTPPADDEMNETLKENFKGELFSIKIYMRTKSNSVINYQRSLIVE